MTFFVVTSGPEDAQGWPPNPAKVKLQDNGPKNGKAVTVIVDGEYCDGSGVRMSPAQHERLGIAAVKAACAELKRARGIR